MQGQQALAELLDSLPGLSMVRQRPAAQDRTDRPPVRKSLFRGEGNGGFGALLGGTSLAAELMDHGRIAQGKTQAKGVCNLVRQGHRLLATRQPLVRRAQVPQRPSGMDAAHHTSVLPIEDRRGVVLLGIVDLYTLRQVRVRRG